MLKALQILTQTKLLPFSKQLFSKYSKPKKNPKLKEAKSSLAYSDDRSAKLSQADAKKKKDAAAALEKQKGPLAVEIDTTDISKVKHQIVDFEYKLEKQKIQELLVKQYINSEDRQNLKQMKAQIEAKLAKIQLPVEQTTDIPEQFPTPNDFQPRSQTALRKKVDLPFYECSSIVNADFYKQIQQNENPPLDSKRTGVLAYKIGMTSVWDKWGRIQPLTVLHVDRCQVIEVKSQEKHGYNALQIGLGQKNLKRLKKPEIGHYLKNGLPPKYQLQEFKISPENALPVGFQITARHFTPGQYVDVQAISKGKGWSGTIWRWNFKSQRASHGNSLSHRVPGSTGQRQDPGRVFKGKKMSGRAGGEHIMVQNQKVYKIDAERQLVFVRGVVPGAPGTVVRVNDSYKKVDENEPYLNFPTFIPIEGEQYAKQIAMIPSKLDPNEIYLHDNDILEDEPEKAETTTGTAEGGAEKEEKKP